MLMKYDDSQVRSTDQIMPPKNCSKLFPRLFNLQVLNFAEPGDERLCYLVKIMSFNSHFRLPNIVLNDLHGDNSGKRKLITTIRIYSEQLLSYFQTAEYNGHKV